MNDVICILAEQGDMATSAIKAFAIAGYELTDIGVNPHEQRFLILTFTN